VLDTLANRRALVTQARVSFSALTLIFAGKLQGAIDTAASADLKEPVELSQGNPGAIRIVSCRCLLRWPYDRPLRCHHWSS